MNPEKRTQSKQEEPDIDNPKEQNKEPDVEKKELSKEEREQAIYEIAGAINHHINQPLSGLTGKSEMPTILPDSYTKEAYEMFAILHEQVGGVVEYVKLLRTFDFSSISAETKEELVIKIAKKVAEELEDLFKSLQPFVDQLKNLDSEGREKQERDISEIFNTWDRLHFFVEALKDLDSGESEDYPGSSRITKIEYKFTPSE